MMPGMLTCIFSGGVAAFGLYILSLCATKTRYRHSSFHAISQLTFPSAAVWFDAAIATKCFGVSIRQVLDVLDLYLVFNLNYIAVFSYLIIIKGLMPSVVETLYHDLTSEDTNPPEWTLNEQNWLIIFMFILAPLSFLRHINSLRHTSYIALFAVGKWVTVRSEA